MEISVDRPAVVSGNALGDKLDGRMARSIKGSASATAGAPAIPAALWLQAVPQQGLGFTQVPGDIIQVGVGFVNPSFAPVEITTGFGAQQVPVRFMNDPRQLRIKVAGPRRRFRHPMKLPAEVVHADQGVALDPMPADVQKVATFFLMMDPPEHTTYRRLISSAFTPRNVRRIEEQIQRILSGERPPVPDAFRQFPYAKSGRRGYGPGPAGGPAPPPDEASRPARRRRARVNALLVPGTRSRARTAPATSPRAARMRARPKAAGAM